MTEKLRFLFAEKIGGTWFDGKKLLFKPQVQWHCNICSWWEFWEEILRRWRRCSITERTTQCGNLAIFLSLWFYVKSILAEFRRSKNAILTILEALDFDFWKNLIIAICECHRFPKIQHSELLKQPKWQSLTLWNQSKLISRKIRVAGEILNLHS